MYRRCFLGDISYYWGCFDMEPSREGGGGCESTVKNLSDTRRGNERSPAHFAELDPIELLALAVGHPVADDHRRRGLGFGVGHRRDGVPSVGRAALAVGNGDGRSRAACSRVRGRMRRRATVRHVNRRRIYHRRFDVVASFDFFFFFCFLRVFSILAVNGIRRSGQRRCRRRAKAVHRPSPTLVT